MPDGLVLTGAVGALAVGTYVFRWLGPALPERWTESAAVRAAVNAAALLLLAGVMTTTALTEGQHFAGFARPLGVAAAGLAAWRRASFVVVILTAAVVTAVCRAAGVP